MARSRRANAVIFAFDFQVNAAIVLMLENIEDLEAIRLEGNYEDIELEFCNNKYILAQAKAVENSSVDFSHVRSNLKKALISLSEGAQKCETSQLIMITNSPNPLNDDLSKGLFFGPSYREYKTLPESSQNLVDSYLNEIDYPLDVNNFMIQVLPFETDNDLERYKVVRQTVEDFVGRLKLNTPGIGQKVLSVWQNDIFENGSRKDATIKLKKSDIIWPIIAIITDVERIDENLSDVFDTSLYEEILFKYKEVIDSCCERCEFFVRVLYDYSSYESNKNAGEKCLDFALEKWGDYKSELLLENADEEMEKGLIQVILYNIVKNRRVIDRIKREVCL